MPLDPITSNQAGYSCELAGMSCVQYNQKYNLNKIYCTQPGEGSWATRGGHAAW